MTDKSDTNLNIVIGFRFGQQSIRSELKMKIEGCVRTATSIILFLVIPPLLSTSPVTGNSAAVVANSSYLEPSSVMSNVNLHGQEREMRIEIDDFEAEPSLIYRGLLFGIIENRTIVATVNGTIVDALNSSLPIADALVSIHLNYEFLYQNVTYHYANITSVVVGSDARGEFWISFEAIIPESPCGRGSEFFPNLTVTAVANKLGYRSAESTRSFHFLLDIPSWVDSYDWLVETSTSNLTIPQGSSRSFLITVTEGKIFAKFSNVSMQAANLPPGVMAQFNPTLLKSFNYSKSNYYRYEIYGSWKLGYSPWFVKAKSNVTISVSDDAPVGNHTISILGYQDSTNWSHRICILLNITPSQGITTRNALFLVAVVAASTLLIVFLLRRNRPSAGQSDRRRKRHATR